MDGRTDSPCVLQDFVPFGAAALLPLNLNHILLKQGTGTADHLLPLGCYFFLQFLFFLLGTEVMVIYHRARSVFFISFLSALTNSNIQLSNLYC